MDLYNCTKHTREAYYNYPYYWDDGLQMRANCYGYALRTFFAKDEFSEKAYYDFGSDWDEPYHNSIYSYKQQPGEFIDKTNGYTMQSLIDILQTNITLTNYASTAQVRQLAYSLSNENAISVFKELIQRDVEAMGYTFEHLATIEYSEEPTYTIPETPADKRLIALVVRVKEHSGDFGDYHFYMQSGNKWSHKPGYGTAKDTCQDGCVDASGNPIELTNENFLTHAFEGIYPKYSHGEANRICFFYINKPSTVDYGHNDGHIAGCTKTVTDYADTAGNAYEQAKYLGTAPIAKTNCRIDYVGDQDHYVFLAEETGTYTISFNNPINTISASLYDDMANPVAFCSNGVNRQITCTLTAGTTYWLAVSASDMEYHKYGWNYSVIIYVN